MGRYWSTRRAGSTGPAAAVGSAVLVDCVTFALAVQDEPNGDYLAEWGQNAPGATPVHVSYQYFLVTAWVEFNSRDGRMDAEFSSAGFAAPPFPGDYWRVVISAPGYLSVTSDPSTVI